MEAIKTINQIIAIPKGISPPENWSQSDGEFFVRMKITPELAAHWLKKNNNRPINKTNVEFLEYELNTGSFEFNGDTIRFDWFGNMLDGQKRCLASVKTGKKFDSIIVCGLNPNVFKTIDTGQSRTAADVFHIEGIENSNAAAAICNFIMQYSKGRKGRLTSYKSAKIDHSDLLNFYKKTPDLSNIISDAIKIYHQSNKLIGASWIGGLHYFFSQKSYFQSKDFFEKLCLGINIEINSPIYILRNRLLKDKIKDGVRLTKRSKCLLIVRCWNSTRTGKAMKASIKEDDRFPEIK